MTRKERKSDTLLKSPVINKEWSDLNPIEQLIIQGIHDKVEMSMKELITLTGRSKPTVLKMLDNLKRKGLIEWYGTNQNDPQAKYKIKN